MESAHTRVMREEFVLTGRVGWATLLRKWPSLTKLISSTLLCFIVGHCSLLHATNHIVVCSLLTQSPQSNDRRVDLPTYTHHGFHHGEHLASAAAGSSGKSTSRCKPIRMVCPTIHGGTRPASSTLGKAHLPHHRGNQLVVS